MRTRARRQGAGVKSGDPIESAQIAGLKYVNDVTMPGIRRTGPRNRVSYVADGRRITNQVELQRIRSLAIPPAWTDVWICLDPRGHLQATGRDARGRKQYRYHPKWREVRDEVKYGRLITFAQTLPRIRRRTAADLKQPSLTRDKVLAAVVQLLEKTLIRVGNEEYARTNNSIGLTTMRDKHARINGDGVRFEFRGKSGVGHAVDLHDRRLVSIVKACRDLPGQDLFQYIDDAGQRQPIGSADVNAYLREIAGQDFTAKDFRTWAGTVLAAKALATAEQARSKTHANRQIVRAIESVAKCLGNTKAVCRKSYIHPAILSAYTEGVTIGTLTARAIRALRKAGLDEAEAASATIIVVHLRRKGRKPAIAKSAAA
ncbi:MAG: DNA topoisomerase IB [Acidobacteriota bacterium]